MHLYCVVSSETKRKKWHVRLDSVEWELVTWLNMAIINIVLANVDLDLGALVYGKLIDRAIVLMR